MKRDSENFVGVYEVSTCFSWASGRNYKKNGFCFLMDLITKALFKSSYSSFTFGEEELEGLVCPQSLKSSNFFQEVFLSRGSF